MNINFNELLKLGLKYEVKAQKIICEKLNTQILNTCDNYKYDFETNENIKYECKFDRISQKTGNFFIEINTYYYKNKVLKNSGLLKTISNYYIIIDDDTNNKIISYYIISTKKLKKLIRNNKYYLKKSCLNKKKLIYSNGVIFKKEVIKKYCKYIFDEKY